MELESTRIFVRVASLGSFSKAAESLKLPKSTVSRTISRLEAESGTRLLTRTTRSLTLTAAGRVFYESCAGPIQLIEDARKSLQGKDSILSGLVRLTAPEDIGDYLVSPALASLTREHPGLAFDFSYTDAVLDLVGEGYDLAVRIGKLSPTRLKARKLGEINLILVASPHYLKDRKPLRSPEDLPQWDCLSYTFRGSRPRWNLQSRSGATSVFIQPRIIGNQMTSLISTAAAGAGVAFVPEYLCQAEIKAGKLVRLLPGWEGAGFSVNLLSPGTHSPRIKVVADRLAEAIRKALVKG